MSTIINNPTPTERTVVERVESDSSGWVVAVLILLAIVAAGAYWWMHHGRVAQSPAQTQPGTVVNVALPGANAGGSSNQ